MRNEIEKYIDKNRSQLDVDVPNDALWGKIEEELDGRKKKRGFYFWWSAAASVVLIASLLIFLKKEIEPKSNALAQNTPSQNQTVASEEKVELDSLSLNFSIDPISKSELKNNLFAESNSGNLLASLQKNKVRSGASLAISSFDVSASTNVTMNSGTYSFGWSNAAKSNCFEVSVSDGKVSKPEVLPTEVYGKTYTIDKKNHLKSTVISGYINLNGVKNKVTDGYVEVLDKSTGKLIGKYFPDAKTGEFSITLNPGKEYVINVDAKGSIIEDNWTKAERLAKQKEEEQLYAEKYGEIVENEWKNTKSEPLSTFSVDVDAAGYSNVRRFLNNDFLPPKNAVKIEEMVNYFGYNYPKPTGEHPLSITTEYGVCPWNTKHKLVHIGLKAKEITQQEIPASNLVFLIDVSGSMQDANKLDLLKQGFSLLTNQLRAQDKVSIVVYAGASGVVLPPTQGNDKATILAALDKLTAGGSTAGAEGIELAYKVAAENYKKNGNNRVILATDGDFNVGISTDDQLVKLIEEKRKSGVFLTVLGFGEGNLQAEKMEKLADNGNGNYAYVDNLMEAKKVLVNEFGALYTVAKDVKLQVEFNPTKVKAYRLLGYENRMLRTQDFDNDTIDAGEMGAGHTVTALYEIIPSDSDEKVFDSPELRYQKTDFVKFSNNNELMYIKFRYKDPEGTQSKLLKHVVCDANSNLTENFYFSAAVAEFGLLIRESKYKGSASFHSIESNATRGFGSDKDGYRHEFVMLVRKAQLLMKK
jgi:Ca-activated chloride channel family protein